MKMTARKTVWGYLALCIAVIASMMLWPLPEGTRSSPVVYRQSMLRSLITAMNNYSDEFDGQLFHADQWHETMDPWLGITSDDPIYFWHDSQALYILPIPWKTLQRPESISTKQLAVIPFMFEDPVFQEEFTSVSFWDGTVRSITDDEFTKLIDTKLGIPLGVPSP